MENLNDVEQMSLVDILKRGGELSNQLKNQTNMLTSKETCKHLIQKILSTCDEAIAYLNLVESPETGNGVRSRCARGHSTRDVFKKRKTLSSSEQIKVHSGTGLEGPLADGHSWRKYGQKHILGAIHPRAYYRCSHKYTRGCVAIKQVQKTEEDPSIVEVTYRGEHTCMDVPNSPSPVVSLENLQQQPEPNQMQNILFECGQCQKVETEEINPKVVEPVSSFSFPSTWIQSENQDIWEQIEDDILASSKSDYFSMSTCQLLPYPHSIRSDLSDMISNPTSGMNSLFDFDMDTVESNIEPNLLFDVLDDYTTIV